MTILVHDQNHRPAPNAIVAGWWSSLPNVSRTCKTGANGTCKITSGTLPASVLDVTFTVTGIAHATLTYQSAANHDPDGDSDGTAIKVYR